MAQFGFKNAGASHPGAGSARRPSIVILRNEVYVGGIYIPKWKLRTAGDFEALVSEETFERVQQVLSGRKKVTAYTRNNPDFPLRRFVSCSGCSRPLTGSYS